MPQRTLWGDSPEESLFNFSDAPSLPDEPEPTPTLRLAQLFLQKLFAYSNFDSHKRECIPENDDGLISSRDVDVKEWFDRVWKVAKHKQIAEYMNKTGMPGMVSTGMPGMLPPGMSGMVPTGMPMPGMVPTGIPGMMRFPSGLELLGFPARKKQKTAKQKTKKKKKNKKKRKDPPPGPTGEARKRTRN